MSSSNRGIVQIMGIVDISYRGKSEIIVVIGISNENFLREPDSCCKSNKGQTCRHSIEPKQTSDAKILTEIHGATTPATGVIKCQLSINC